jgi:exonuclease I
VDQENEILEEKLGKLTSEHMALQANHKELECSHDKLVDSYATLEIAHEVVLSSVKFIQPLSRNAHAHKFKLICLALMIVSLKQANLALSMYL